MYRKIIGILFIILGLLFIVFPFISAVAVSMIAGVSLIIFGFAAIFNAFSPWSIQKHISYVEVAFGIILIILGFLFLINLTALSFFVAYAFYLIAIALIFIGITGLLVQDENVSKWASALILILGIIFIFLGIFSITDPLFITIFIGICLILRGVILLADDTVI